MSAFEKLIGELDQLNTDQETMAKALPADDGKDEDKIQAAAEEGGGSDGDADNAGGKPDGDADDKAPMAKSFTLKLEDGTEVEAQDGAELVKALQDRIEANEGAMAKALGSAVNLIKGQGEMIKSLSDRIAKLSGEGRGRKTVVSVVEKPAGTAETMAKSHQPEGMTDEVFFAKALTAQKEGRITGTDIAYAEALRNKGQPLPAALVARVVQ